MLARKKMSLVKKSILISVLVILLAAIGYLLYDNFFTGQLSTDYFDDELIEEQLAIETSLIDPKINSDFLRRQPYVSLQTPSRLPVEPGSVGRNNPFLALPFGFIE